MNILNKLKKDRKKTILILLILLMLIYYKTPVDGIQSGLASTISSVGVGFENLLRGIGIDPTDIEDDPTPPGDTGGDGGGWTPPPAEPDSTSVFDFIDDSIHYGDTIDGLVDGDMSGCWLTVYFTFEEGPDYPLISGYTDDSGVFLFSVDNLFMFDDEVFAFPLLSQAPIRMMGLP